MNRPPPGSPDPDDTALGWAEDPTAEGAPAEGAPAEPTLPTHAWPHRQTRPDRPPPPPASIGGPSSAGGAPIGAGPRTPTASWAEVRRAERHDRGQGGVNNGPIIAGTILILLGGLFLLRQFIDIDLSSIWPIAAIAFGLVLIVRAFTRGPRRG